MKKSVPEAFQSNFVPVFDHESEWKQAAAFASPDDAYLMIVDHLGKVLWQTHGKCTSDKTQAVMAEIVRQKDSVRVKP